MARGPKPVPLILSAEERAALAALVRGHRTGQALAQRARIVLACAEPGATNTSVARALGVSRPSVTTGAEPALRRIERTGGGTRRARGRRAQLGTSRLGA